MVIPFTLRPFFLAPAITLATLVAIFLSLIIAAAKIKILDRYVYKSD